MDPEAISTKLKAFLEESFPNPGQELSASTDLLNSWFIDSLGIVQTVIFLETSFGCDVKPEDMIADNFETVERLTEFVVRQQQQ